LYSQRLRWEANLFMINRLLSPVGELDVVDFGCGTGGFYFHLQGKGRLRKYIGIEIRPDARAEAHKFSKIHRDMNILSDTPEKEWFPVDAIVANAVYGFPEQNPLADLVQLKKVFPPRVLVVDFFSTLRPYEPEDPDGYFAFDPFKMVKKLRRLLSPSKFILDHSYMPHAFTVGLGFTDTDWGKEEKRAKSVRANSICGRSCG
jgi:SAM-dependent methyltransferase